MGLKRISLVSLASALAALSPAPNADAKPTHPATEPAGAPQPSDELRPNLFYSLGDDLMSLVTYTKADGTVEARHYSHSSHSSHSSHYSRR